MVMVIVPSLVMAAPTATVSVTTKHVTIYTNVASMDQVATIDLNTLKYPNDRKVESM